MVVLYGFHVGNDTSPMDPMGYITNPDNEPLRGKVPQINHTFASSLIASDNMKKLMTTDIPTESMSFYFVGDWFLPAYLWETRFLRKTRMYVYIYTYK